MQSSKSPKFIIIGNGSNLLINDARNFNGLVIKMSIKGINIESHNKKNTIVSACAGESIDDLINFMINKKLSGIENLWNIPGTIGASVVQNIGAYGAEVKNYVFYVEGINTKNLKRFKSKNKDCNFEYRNSIFKKNKHLIITKVFLKLNNHFLPNLEYPALKKCFKSKKNIKIKQVIKTIEKIRSEKLPDYKVLASAGSFFKNPILTVSKYKELLRLYPALPCYKDKNHSIKIPLGFVIDKICDMRGYRNGQVGLFEKQSLIIVNYGGATYSSVDNFAKFIENKVFKKTKIKIEREVENIF